MLLESLEHAWPPFALVTGLLLIGAVAHRDGLFAAAGRALEGVPGPPVALFVVGAGLVVGVTAVLNLDTAWGLDWPLPAAALHGHLDRPST